MPDEINTQQLLRIEATVFQRLVKHLQKRSDVQNVDLMILSDFCRNCLARWYKAAAQNEGLDLDYEQAREQIYGMPYKLWKEKYQMPLTAEQEKALVARKKNNA